MGRIAMRRLASGLVLAMAVSAGPAGAAAAAGTGSISGQISDAGTPVAGVVVSVVLSVYPVAVAQTTTDGSGAFHIEVAPGTYKLRFELPGGLTQFSAQVTDFAAATELTVVDGADIVVTELVVPHGSVSGQITTSTGGAAAGAYVGLVQFSGVPVANVLAGRDGRYAFPFVAPGRYALTVGASPTGAPRQWARGHKTRAEADLITVTAGQSSTVDEQLLPLGTVRGTFTGATGPIEGVGVLAESRTSAFESVSTATRADGTYTLKAYPGTYRAASTSGPTGKRPGGAPTSSPSWPTPRSSSTSRLWPRGGSPAGSRMRPATRSPVRASPSPTRRWTASSRRPRTRTAPGSRPFGRAPTR